MLTEGAVTFSSRRDNAIFHFSNSSVQVLDNAIETEKMIEKYESLASDLLEWIEQTIIILNNRKFANSLVGVQQQLQAFNTYRTVEKPPKYDADGVPRCYCGGRSLPSQTLLSDWHNLAS